MNVTGVIASGRGRFRPFGRWCALVWTVLAAATSGADPSAPAQNQPAANPLAELATMGYQPKGTVQGDIRLAGSGTLQQAAAHWCEGFGRMHPAAKCSINDCGSEAGLKALLEGKADVALLSRPVQDAEKESAAKRGDRKLVVVVVGFDRLVWIVPASNPVTELKWSPETGVLRPAQGQATAATHWDALNGAADWKDVAIRVHGYALGSGTRWHLDRLLTGASAYHPEVREHKSEAELAEAVAGDRGGLGLVGDEHAHWPGVKRLPLVVPADASPLADAVVGSDRTPDCRPLFVAVSVPATGELPGSLREFLEYVLSFPGQLDVAKDGLMPLSRSEIHAQKNLLGWAVAR
jgi:phosphate transport system substrate-binding protein